MIFLIKSYQYCISPYIISSCRYHVNCSNFMIRSIKNKGIIKGLLFGIVRIIKCNPFINHN
ncbi:MAG: membrane protein insertion efficiency factor YidD [Bacteroides sp.]|nr:MAG: membrane protein insertion efficiency factor YidD [Bacteroides sp.]